MCDNKTSVATMILTYLADHPEAEDTLQGIGEWWILDRYIEIQTSEVRKGLEELMSNELVVQRKGNDGTVRYRVNREKLTEIQALRRPRD